MRIFILPLLLTLLFGPVACARNAAAPTVGPGPDISIQYLQEARKYRAEGKYELARQSYAQALSTCRSNANLEVIKRELAGTELLIRTMR